MAIYIIEMMINHLLPKNNARETSWYILMHLVVFPVTLFQ